MAFTSFYFLFFVALVICVYYAFPKNGRWLVLLTASYAFYLISSPRDVPVRHIHDGHNLLRRQIYRKAEQRAQGLSQPTQGRTFKGRQKGSQSRCTEKKAKDGSPHTGCQFCCACSSQVFLSCAGGNGVGTTGSIWAC